jgi:hypothetical protein
MVISEYETLLMSDLDEDELHDPVVALKMDR